MHPDVPDCKSHACHALGIVHVQASWWHCSAGRSTSCRSRCGLAPTPGRRLASRWASPNVICPCTHHDSHCLIKVCSDLMLESTLACTIVAQAEFVSTEVQTELLYARCRSEAANRRCGMQSREWTAPTYCVLRIGWPAFCVRPR